MILFALPCRTRTTRKKENTFSNWNLFSKRNKVLVLIEPFCSDKKKTLKLDVKVFLNK